MHRLTFAFYVFVAAFIGCDDWPPGEGRPGPWSQAPKPSRTESQIPQKDEQGVQIAPTTTQLLASRECQGLGMRGRKALAENEELNNRFGLCSEVVWKAWGDMDVWNTSHHNREEANLRFVEESFPFVTGSWSDAVGPTLRHFVCEADLPLQRRQEFLAEFHRWNQRAYYFWSKQVSPYYNAAQTIEEYCEDRRLEFESDELRRAAFKASLIKDADLGGGTIQVCIALGLSTQDEEARRLCQQTYEALAALGEKLRTTDTQAPPQEAPEPEPLNPPPATPKPATQPADPTTNAPG